MLTLFVPNSGVKLPLLLYLLFGFAVVLNCFAVDATFAFPVVAKTAFILARSVGFKHWPAGLDSSSFVPFEFG
ncbi:MAG: hypothetical protein AAF993_05740 [Pseudomonadota bacterium]